ncbi:6164_t:CDS:1, partial [Ambispora gerdemannii]
MASKPVLLLVSFVLFAIIAVTMTDAIPVIPVDKPVHGPGFGHPGLGYPGFGYPGYDP